MGKLFVAILSLLLLASCGGGGGGGTGEARASEIGNPFTVTDEILYLRGCLVTAYTFDGTMAEYTNSGNSDDVLTCDGRCLYTDGVYGQALQLGLHDKVWAAHSDDLDPSINGWTLAFWTFGTDVENYSSIVDKYDGGSGWGVGTDIFPEDRVYVTFSDNNSHYRLKMMGQTTEARWHHVAVVYDGLLWARLYIDGQLAVVDTMVSFNSSLGPMYIGSASHDPGAEQHQYAGFFDDVCFFHAVFSQENVQILMDNGIEVFMTAE